MVKYTNKKAEILHECYLFIKKEIASFNYVKRKQKFLKKLKKKYPMQTTTFMKYFSEARKNFEKNYQHLIKKHQ